MAVPLELSPRMVDESGRVGHIRRARLPMAARAIS
jgi:hypothetical protein